MEYNQPLGIVMAILAALAGSGVMVFIFRKRPGFIVTDYKLPSKPLIQSRPNVYYGLHGGMPPIIDRGGDWAIEVMDESGRTRWIYFDHDVSAQYPIGSRYPQQH